MRRFHWLFVACMLLVHGTAFAQSEGSPSARTQASARFNRGVELFQDEAYRAALIEFERAYEIMPDYRLLYNIGRTKVELQDFQGAALAYERYLTEGGNAIPKERRDEVEPALRALLTRIGRISLSVNRDGADVFIDDVKVGQTPITGTISVNVGRHRIAVRAPDGATDSQLVDIAGDEIAEISITLAPPKPDVVAMPQQDQGMPIMRKMAVTGWVVGGGLLLGSVVTGVLTMQANDDFDTLLKRVNIDPNDESDHRKKVKARALATDILVASGAAFAVAGTVLWLLDRRSERKDDEQAKKTSKLEWDVGVGSVGVHGQF